jgi:hypothetical protein
MIDESQAIVLVSILPGPQHTRTRSGIPWAVQRVKVLSVLKGNLRGEMDVELTPYLLFPAATHLERSEFSSYEQYVLFIARDYQFPGRKYSIVNLEGSAFWIPITADLSNLTDGDVRGNIEILLNAALSYSKSREQVLDKCIHEYLSDAPRACR